MLRRDERLIQIGSNHEKIVYSAMLYMTGPEYVDIVDEQLKTLNLNIHVEKSTKKALLPNTQ